MKARTKLQHQVTELSQSLPRISLRQQQWAHKECLPHIGYANKTSAFCLDCGETFSLDKIKRNRATCPHCNTKITIEHTKKRTNERTNYFAITHVVDDFQVVENFELIAYYKKGNPVKHFIHAILEDWILPNGKVTKIGNLHTTTGYCDSWGGNWEIRDNGSAYWNNSKYNVYARRYHPNSVFKIDYKKYGIDHNLSGMNVIEAIKIIPNSPKAETLLKAKQYGLLGYYETHSGLISRYWSSIKICLRNKYKVIDASMWLDYLELLRYFNKDLNNCMYACPNNLKKEHDRLMNKKREILRLEEQKRAREATIKRQQKLETAVVQYIEHFKKFFDLEFTKGNISIKVLQSVDEFREEGDELKHCVFTNEYYLKEKSLILSARVDGIRAETIEISLEKMKIEQSRGLRNQATNHHDKIVELVKKNLEQIKKIANNNGPRSAKKQAA